MTRPEAPEREPWSARDQFKRNAAYTLAQPALNGAENERVPPKPVFVTAVDLMRQEFDKPIWAVPGVIPDGATMVVGRPKQGKSWLLLGLGLAIAYGGKALSSIDVEQGEVLLLCLEDTLRRLKTRLETILDGEAPPVGLTFVTDWPRLDEGGAELLGEWIVAHPSARMVGIDVLTRLRPPVSANGSGDLYQRDYQLMRAVKSVADETHVPITVVHHSRKASADDPFDTISGTNGLAAAADTALILTRERGAADANLYLRGRDVEEADLALKFDPVTCQWLLLGDAGVYGLTEGRQEIITLLAARGELSPKEVAGALGRDRVAIRKTLSRMFHDSQLEASHGVYRLPVAVTPIPFSTLSRESIDKGKTKYSSHTDTSDTSVTGVTGPIQTSIKEPPY